MRYFHFYFFDEFMFMAKMDSNFIGEKNTTKLVTIEKNKVKRFRTQKIMNGKIGMKKVEERTIDIHIIYPSQFSMHHNIHLVKQIENGVTACMRKIFSTPSYYTMCMAPIQTQCIV